MPTGALLSSTVYCSHHDMADSMGACFSPRLLCHSIAMPYSHSDLHPSLHDHTQAQVSSTNHTNKQEKDPPSM